MGIILFMSTAKTTQKNNRLSFFAAVCFLAVGMLCLLKSMTLDRNVTWNEDLRTFYWGLTMCFVLWGALTLAGKRTVTLILPPVVGHMTIALIVVFGHGTGVLFLIQFIVAIAVPILVGFYNTLEIFGRIGRKAVVATRLIWLALAAFFLVFSVIIGFTRNISMACMYLFFFISAHLITMPCTIRALRIFMPLSRGVFWLPGVMALVFSVNFFSEDSYASVWLNLLTCVSPVLVGAGALCFGIWMTGVVREDEGRTDLKFRITFALVAVLLTSVSYFLFWSVRDKDLKVRQDRAVSAFRTQVLNRDEYNWNEMEGDEFYVPRDRISYNIAYADPEGMPVLFLRCDSAAGGDYHRVVLYDEQTGVVRQVFGKEIYSNLVGYQPVDEEHRYPIVIFVCGSMGDHREYVCQVIGSEMTVLGSCNDYSMSPRPDLPNEYTWNGRTVDEEEYLSEHNKAVDESKLVEVEWNHW